MKVPKNITTPERDHRVHTESRTPSSINSIPIPPPRKIFRPRGPPIVTESPSRMRGLVDRVTAWAQGLSTPSSSLVETSIKSSDEALRPGSFTSMSDALDADDVDYEDTDPDTENQAGSSEDPVHLGLIKRAVSRAKKEKENRNRNPEMKHRTDTSEGVEKLGFVTFSEMDNQAESIKDSPRLGFFMVENETSVDEEDYQNINFKMMEHQVESSDDPVQLGFFEENDVAGIHEDHQDTDPEGLTSETGKVIKTKTKTKTHRVTKSKMKKRSGKVNHTNVTSKERQSAGAASKSQSRSNGKKTYEAQSDNKRQIKEAKRKADKDENEELDDIKSRSTKKAKSESPDMNPKSKNKSQPKRKRTKAGDDSNGPQKQIKTKPPEKTSTRHQPKRESDERGLISKNVQFKSPVESTKTQLKKSSETKKRTSDLNRASSSSSIRHLISDIDVQSDSEEYFTFDGDSVYSFEDDDYGDTSESPSPEYQDQYSDDEDDYDYVSAPQSPDPGDRYSDEKIRITRGERNELLNELTRERGQRLVESMEIPKDRTIGSDQMKLFQKLAIRGCKPIMSGDWACDFPTLPNALFTRLSDGTDDEDLPFEPKWGSSNYAIKALQEVFAIGGRVRDAEYLTISQHVIIERSIRKYMQRVMYSAGLQTVKSAIPVHTIVCQKPGEDLVATLDRATKLLRGLMWRHMESHEDHTGKFTYWPVLIGFVIAGPILCLLSLDGNPDNEANKKAPEDEPVVRFMTHVDFSHAPFDVWNSLAAVICISHVRDTCLRLAELWEGFRTVHRFRDKADETDDEDA